MKTARHITDSPRITEVSEFASLFGAVWTWWIFESQVTAGCNIFSLCPVLLHILIFAVLSGNCSHSVFCSENSRAEETYAVLSRKEIVGVVLKAGKENKSSRRGISSPTRNSSPRSTKSYVPFWVMIWSSFEIKHRFYTTAHHCTIASPVSLHRSGFCSSVSSGALSHLNLSSPVQLWMFCGWMKKLSMSMPFSTSFWSLLCDMLLRSFFWTRTALFILCSQQHILLPITALSSAEKQQLESQ